MIYNKDIFAQNKVDKSTKSVQKFNLIQNKNVTQPGQTSRLWSGILLSLPTAAPILPAVPLLPVSPQCQETHDPAAGG